MFPADANACPQGLITKDGHTTLEGTPRALVPAADRRATLEAVEFVSRVARGPSLAASEARVRVRNAGKAVWPALGVGDTALVQLGYRWLDAAGQLLPMAAEPPPCRPEAGRGERGAARLVAP